MHVAALREDMASQIVLMDPLHDDDARAGLRVIQAC
jgi:hypothetical protein